jgi:hypothetical protein
VIAVSKIIHDKIVKGIVISTNNLELALTLDAVEIPIDNSPYRSIHRRSLSFCHPPQTKKYHTTPLCSLTMRSLFTAAVFALGPIVSPVSSFAPTSQMVASRSSVLPLKVRHVVKDVGSALQNQHSLLRSVLGRRSLIFAVQ